MRIYFISHGCDNIVYYLSRCGCIRVNIRIIRIRAVCSVMIYAHCFSTGKEFAVPFGYSALISAVNIYAQVRVIYYVLIVSAVISVEKFKVARYLIFNENIAGFTLFSQRACKGCRGA